MIQNKRVNDPCEDTIICGDCRDLMDKMASDSVDMLITSPPYNLGVEYDSYDDNLELKSYLEFLNDVWKKAYRIIKPGGRIAITIANIRRSPFIPLTSYVTQQLIENGYILRGYIYWDKGFESSSTAWGSFQSASNPVLVNDRETIIVGYKNSPKLQHTGTSTITKKEFMTNVQSVWKMNAEHVLKTTHPAPFPEEMPRRLIRLYTYEHDLIFDPFCGSGTVPFVAKMNNRRYVACDVSEHYCEMAKSRCTQERLDV